MRAAVLCYVHERGGPGVPVEPASRCCEGKNKHSPTGLFTKGVNLNFYFTLWYQGLYPPLLRLASLRLFSFPLMLFSPLSHSLTATLHLSDMRIPGQSK